MHSLQRIKRLDAIVDSIRELAIKAIKINPNIPTEASFAIENIASPVFLVNWYHFQI